MRVTATRRFRNPLGVMQAFRVVDSGIQDPVLVFEGDGLGPLRRACSSRFFPVVLGA